MAIQDRDSQRSVRLVLTRCPLDWCGADLSGQGVKTADHFYDEHGPADFGLSPLREVDS